MRRFLPVFLVLLLILMVSAQALCEIKGKVVDKDGKPVPGAKVSVEVHDWDTGKTSRQEPVKLDKDGAFTFSAPKLKDGSCYFTAKAPGYCVGRARSSLQNTREAVITMFPERKISVKVIDERKKPVPGAVVAIRNFSARNSSTRKYYYLNNYEDENTSFTAGKDGVAVLRNLPDLKLFDSGQLGLSITAAGRAKASRSYDLKAIKPTFAVLSPQGCKLSGTLYLPGRSAAAPEGTEILAGFTEIDEFGTVSARVDKNGKFRFNTLPSGKVRLLLGPDYQYEDESKTDVKIPECPQWMLPVVKDVKVSSGKETVLDVELAPGVLARGTVVDSKTGKPVENAIIEAYHEGRPEYATPTYAKTNEKGEFTLRAAAGVVSISVSEVLDKDGSEVDWDFDMFGPVCFKAVDGQDKNDLVVRITCGDIDDSRFDLADDDIPDDFEFKAGTYDLAWDPELNHYDDTSYEWLLNKAKARSKIRKLPKLVSEYPIYLAVPFDGAGDEGLLLAVMDESGGTKTGYDMAYIDTNRNGDLSDEEPVYWREDSYETRSPWVQVQSCQGRVDGGQTSHPVQFRISYYSLESREVDVHKRGGWKGMIDSNKGKREFVLADWNLNGIYGDPQKVANDFSPEDGDYAFVDTTGYGRVIPYEFCPHGLGLTEVMKLKEKFYRVQSNGVGSQVTIEPFTGPFGQLKVTCGNINSISASTLSTLVMGQPGRYVFKDLDGKPVMLPEGKYKINTSHVSLKAGKNGKFNIGCETDITAEVKADRPCEVAIDGKLKMAIQPDKKLLTLKSGGSAEIEWAISIGDKAKVVYMNNGERQIAPTVKFFDKKGKMAGKTTAGFT